MIQLTEHAQLRAAQRNLSLDEIEYVVYYGVLTNCAGALIYYLRARDVPEWDKANTEIERLIGTAVIVSKDDYEVITTWRNKRWGYKRIKRKSKHNIPVAYQH